MSTDYSTEPAVNNLREYLRIRSVQPNVNYDDCCAFLRRQARDIGLSVQVFELVPKKPVVLMTWEGEDPQLPSIFLLSHMDVVPLTEEVWDYPPFDACLVEGRIYARGAQDMKAQTMQHIEAIRRLKRKNIKLKRTVHVCCVPDEEIGGEEGMGIFAKSDAFKKLNVGFCIDEGSGSSDESLIVYNGAKSIWHLNVVCRGTPGHGSLIFPNTCGDKIRYILDKFLDLRKESLQKLQTSSKPLLLALGDVVTANLTMLHGGTQNNVIPDKMVASFDIRLPPTTDWGQFEDQIKQWCEEAGKDVTYEFEQRDPISAPISLDESNTYWTAFKSALHKLNIPFKVGIFPAGNDSRFVREQNVLALSFSPLRFTEVTAHSRNESLLASVFLEGIKIFEKVIHALCDS